MMALPLSILLDGLLQDIFGRPKKAEVRHNPYVAQLVLAMAHSCVIALS